MNIFKNLSKQDLKKVTKLETTNEEFKNKEGLFVSFAFLFWNDDGEKLEQIENIKKSVVFGDLNLIKEDKNNKAEMLKALSIAKLKDIKRPAVKIGYAYYNPEFIYFAFAALNPARTCIYQQPTNQQNPMIYMTDGETKFVCMPLRVNEKSELDQHNIVKPEFITAEDVEKAKKYKLHLKKASQMVRLCYKTENNIMIEQMHQSGTRYFVVFPQNNDFLKDVFGITENTYFDVVPRVELEFDENKTKNVEDLFHKKVTYAKAVQGYGRDREFYHLYENGTGVCFTA